MDEIPLIHMQIVHLYMLVSNLLRSFFAIADNIIAGI